MRDDWRDIWDHDKNLFLMMAKLGMHYFHSVRRGRVVLCKRAHRCRVYNAISLPMTTRGIVCEGVTRQYVQMAKLEYDIS